MSKDKIEVSMSVHDIPIVIKALEKAEDEIKKLNNIIDKTNWWLEEMLKQAKNEETKAIISGALELLLKDN